MSERKGYFVVVEGNERTGKTTQLPLIEAELKARGYDVVVTREPGGTPFAEQLRGMILDNSDGKNLDPVTELLLMTAARQDHYVKVIKPAVESGKVVLCSRGFFSTFALQVHPYGSDELMGLFNHISSINMAELGDVRPMMVNLTLSDEERAKRFAERPVEDVIEGRDAAYQAKVDEAYGLLANQPGTITKDGALPAEQIASEVVEELVGWFAEQDKRFAEAATPVAEEQVAEEPTSDNPEAPVSEPEVADIDTIKTQLLAELDRHATSLIQMVPEADRCGMAVDWHERVDLMRQWIDTYVEELTDKGAVYGQEEAAHLVQKISDNLGALLGSWLTMRNIEVMLNHKKKETA